MAVAMTPWGTPIIPQSVSSNNIKLISPFITGNGKDFSDFSIFCEPGKLYTGMILSTGPIDLDFFVKETVTAHDFFEDLSVAKCQLISNNPNNIIDINVKEVYTIANSKQEQ